MIDFDLQKTIPTIILDLLRNQKENLKKELQFEFEKECQGHKWIGHRIELQTIKSCWIADANRDLNLTKCIANNRIDINSAKYPCPNYEIKDRIKRIILEGSL
jgi:hypothetical protein